MDLIDVIIEGLSIDNFTEDCPQYDYPEMREAIAQRKVVGVTFGNAGAPGPDDCVAYICGAIFWLSNLDEAECTALTISLIKGYEQKHDPDKEARYELLCDLTRSVQQFRRAKDGPIQEVLDIFAQADN